MLIDVLLHDKQLSQKVVDFPASLPLNDALKFKVDVRVRVGAAMTH
jgi:hypothetical protein